MNAEPLAATASRVDRWILVEYRGLWGYDALEASTLPAEVKAHLRERAAALAPAKVIVVRARERRYGLHAFWGGVDGLFSAAVERYEDLLGLDFESPRERLDHPLILVCTHGKHDRCCARYGRPLYEALREQADDGWVWQCSHVGGDRFAGNVVVLPEGLYFGRVSPGDAWAVLDEYLAGRIHAATYRGCSRYPFAVQAAERAVREATGQWGTDDLELVSGEPIRFQADGHEYEIVVERGAGELTYLTCSAENLRHPRHFAAGSPRERGG